MLEGGQYENEVVLELLLWVLVLVLTVLSRQEKWVVADVHALLQTGLGLVMVRPFEKKSWISYDCELWALTRTSGDASAGYFRLYQ